MRTLSLPLAIIAAHIIGDWFCQNNWMALNKSKRNDALTIHVLVVSAWLMPWGLGYASLNFVLHWLVDYVTSRCTTKLWFIEFGKPYATNLFDWAKIDLRKRSLFFKMIGLDQLIHYVSLAITYKLVFGG